MLRREKGVDLLLHAMIKIKESIPKIHLYIAGTGPQKSVLNKLANDLDINDDITFLGFISNDDKYSYIKSTDICVFPSTYEPFGIVLLEAMICGKPVVASHVGGISYVVDDG